MNNKLPRKTGGLDHTSMTICSSIQCFGMTVVGVVMLGTAGFFCLFVESVPSHHVYNIILLSSGAVFFILQLAATSISICFFCIGIWNCIQHFRGVKQQKEAELKSDIKEACKEFVDDGINDEQSSEEEEFQEIFNFDDVKDFVIVDPNHQYLENKRIKTWNNHGKFRFRLIVSIIHLACSVVLCIFPATLLTCGILFLVHGAVVKVIVGVVCFSVASIIGIPLVFVIICLGYFIVKVLIIHKNSI